MGGLVVPDQLEQSGCQNAQSGQKGSDRPHQVSVSINLFGIGEAHRTQSTIEYSWRVRVLPLKLKNAESARPSRLWPRFRNPVPLSLWARLRSPASLYHTQPPH